MNWELMGIAVLLTLAGFYLLESTLVAAPLQDVPHRVLKPARNAVERAWHAEPVQVFMRQLLGVRQRRAASWGFRRGPS